MTHEPFPPQHMDRWSRNERLYHFLLQMGHVVCPIFAEGSNDRIESLYVSVSCEQAAQQTAMTGVVPAVKRPQVADIVAPTETLGSGVVIDFPPIR